VHALILAAGIGWRLGRGEAPPKSLIRFDGRSLLERHLEILFAHGVDEVVVGIGYQAERVEAELERLGYGERVRTVPNADYHEGNIVTLWCLREHLERSGPLLLMDADVLYAPGVMARLVASPHANCFLLDRGIEPGEEPVKLAVRGGRPVEFGKALPPGLEYDYHGESVGFFKLEERMGARLGALARRYLERGRRDAFYEDALRDLLLETPHAFGFEDVTGLPWIEIDFREDIERAEREVLPRIRGR